MGAGCAFGSGCFLVSWRTGGTDAGALLSGFAYELPEDALLLLLFVVIVGGISRFFADVLA